MGPTPPCIQRMNKKKANPSENSEEISIKSTLKRASEEGWWL